MARVRWGEGNGRVRSRVVPYTPRMSNGGFSIRRMLGSVLKAPTVWAEALRAAISVAPRRWWSRTSHLPLPDPVYLGWRAQTAYGDASPDPEDLVPYLEWRRRQRRLGR